MKKGLFKQVSQKKAFFEVSKLVKKDVICIFCRKRVPQWLKQNYVKKDKHELWWNKNLCTFWILIGTTVSHSVWKMPKKSHFTSCNSHLPYFRQGLSPSNVSRSRFFRIFWGHQIMSKLKLYYTNWPLGKQKGHQNLIKWPNKKKFSKILVTF